MAQKKPRGRESAHDMVLSLGVVFIVVLVILVITQRKHSQVLPNVNYSQALATAASQDDIPALKPQALPKGAHVTSARFEPESYGATGDVRWYVGLTLANSSYVSLWQSTGPGHKIVSGVANGGMCQGTRTIAAQIWSLCDGGRPTSRVLFRTAGGVTTVVSGSATWADLVAFITSLIPVHVH